MTQYQVLTPVGVVDVEFRGDDLPPRVSGPDSGVRLVRDIVAGTAGARGMLATLDQIEPEDFEHVCRAREEIMLIEQERAPEPGDFDPADEFDALPAVDEGAALDGAGDGDEGAVFDAAAEWAALPDDIAAFDSAQGGEDGRRRD